MKYSEYSKNGYRLYSAFCKQIKSDLSKALKKGFKDALWSISSRAKKPKSLKEKLKNRGLKKSKNIENEIKDLAGCRLIFYRNDQVEHFLNARILDEIFDIEWENFRVHIPVEDNPTADQLYRAQHITVKLKPEKIQELGLEKFSGLRCEIQLQTILNHAWSETGHDVIYKPQLSAGFGTKQYDEIKLRMAKIMQDYLVPAGFEFQKVLLDYQKLAEGKRLFDQDQLKDIRQAKTNDVLHEILEGFRKFVIPQHDNPDELYESAIQIALEAIELSRNRSPEVIKTAYMEYPGKDAKAVSFEAIHIITSLRFVDPKKTFLTLKDLYLNGSEVIKTQATEAVKLLAENHLDVWTQYGPAVQEMLIECMEELTNDELVELQPFIYNVLKEIFNLEIEGTTSTFDAVTIRTATAPPSQKLEEIRTRGLNILFKCYALVTSISDKQKIIKTLFYATQTPMRGFTDDIHLLVFKSICGLFNFLQEHVKTECLEILVDVELRAFWIKIRTHNLMLNPNAGPELKAEAEVVTELLNKYHETICSSPDFVRFRTIVGNNLMTEEVWTKVEANYDQNGDIRRSLIENYINDIEEDTANSWMEFIKYCMSLKQQDSVSLIHFYPFLKTLYEVKPEHFMDLLNDPTEELESYIPAILEGLYKSPYKGYAENLVSKWASESVYLESITYFYFSINIRNISELEELLTKSINSDSQLSVDNIIKNCISAAEEEFEAGLIPIFTRAIQYFTLNQNASWITGSWYKIAKSYLFTQLDQKEVDEVLNNLVFVNHINTDVEWVLQAISNRFPMKILQYCKSRIDYQLRLPENPRSFIDRYEAIPFEFHTLQESLKGFASEIIENVKKWKPQEPVNLPYEDWYSERICNLIKNIFPNFEGLETPLKRLIRSQDNNQIDLVISIIKSYTGQQFLFKTVTELLKEISIDDTVRLRAIEFALHNRGVMSGYYGGSEALKLKKQYAQAWLRSRNERVKAFAKQYIAKLDRQIAAERHREEQHYEMHRRG